MSVTKMRTCASRRGCTVCALLRFGAFWRPTSPPFISKVAFCVGRAFLGDADFDQRAVRIAEPQAVRFEALGRIEPVDPQLLQPLAEARHVVLERAERDVGELLARPLGHHAPAVRMAVGVERELAVLFLGVEPEQAIELLGLGHVRHDEVEMVERMHAELAGTARRPAGPWSGSGSWANSFAEPKICARPSRAQTPPPACSACRSPAAAAAGTPASRSGRRSGPRGPWAPSA